MPFFECGGGLPTQEKSVTATTSQQIVLPDTGFAMSKVTVNPQNHSGSATPASRTSSYDLGLNHNVRYINTNSVPNSNSGTYSATSRSSSLDMGSTNSYRYVDTTGVPNSNSGTYPATSRGSSLDMGSTNSYRYVNTTGVPATYDGWHTLWTGTAKNASSYSYSSSKPSSKSGYSIIYKIDYYPYPSDGGLLISEQIYFDGSSIIALIGYTSSSTSSTPYARTLTMGSSSFTLTACQRIGSTTTNNNCAVVDTISYTWVKNDFTY